MKVRRVTYRVFEVESESNPGESYYVWFDPLRGRFICNCPNYQFRASKGKRCKHVLKVLSMLGDEYEI